MGGMNKTLEYSIYPRGCTQFPHFVISDADAVGIRLQKTQKAEEEEVVPSKESTLAVHWFPEEPSYAMMLQAAQSLLEHGYDGCMLLVGSLRPAVNGGAGTSRSSSSTSSSTSSRPVGEGSPQLRGILLHRSQLPNPLVTLLPTAAVEHGWFPCAASSGTLRFAFQSQEGELLLRPAVLAPLASLGFRLWRKGQSTFSLAPRNERGASSSSQEKKKKKKK